MDPIKKILVAVDGSEPSERAALRALDLAKALGANLKLVHAVAPLVYPAEAMMVPTGELEKARLDAANDLLKEVGARLAAQAGPVKLDRVVLSGPPAETIADEAKTQGDQLIIVGSRGRGAIARLLLGSVADRIVHISTVPVLVVR